MSMWWQHSNEINKETKKIIDLDGSESRRCVKVDAYEILIYNTDVSYLPLSEMGHIAMLHLN